MYRRVALTATVACGALLFIGHLKRKFRRNACAAVRVFIHQLQKVRHETLKVTWFVKRGLADADALRALLDPRVELVVVATGRLADVDAATEILVSGDAPPYDADPGGLARLARLEAFLQPYAGVPDVVAKALRRERRRRNVNDLTPLVCCNSHHNAPMTAELAVALALAAAKRLCVADERLRRGDWRTRGLPAPPPGYGGESPLPQLTLDGKKALVAGLGAVGSRVAVALAALGARVSATSRSCSASRETTLACGAASALVTLEPAARFVDLLADCRLLVLCVPLSPETTGLVDAAALAALPSDAVVVNAARGPVVDEAALYAALASRSVAAYASDVWYHYPATWDDAAATAPWSPACDLAALPAAATVLSPHRGGAVGLPETERRRYAAVADAINAVAKSGDFARLATGPIGGLNIDAGY